MVRFWTSKGDSRYPERMGEPTHVPGWAPVLYWVQILPYRVSSAFCDDVVGAIVLISLGRMKALLFTLLRACEFELAVPKDEIQGKGE